MTLLRPYGCQPAVGDANLNYSGQEMRQLVRALARGSGVMGGSSLKVTQRGSGANFSFDVAEGNAIIDGGDTSGQQAYVVSNTADGYNISQFATGSPPYTFSGITAPGSGTRNHRVVAQVKDYRNNAAWTAGTYSWDVLLLQDTGTGTPAVPASAIGLARIAISSGQTYIATANITDDRAILPMAGYSDSWHNFTLQRGWANRGAGYVRAQYRIQYLGGGRSVVYVIGEISGGTAADNTVIATLPAGWQPGANQHVWCAAGSRSANNDPPNIFVSTSGDLSLQNCGGAATVYFNGVIHLDAASG